ncbi:MAG: hypothetical protein ACOCR6_03975, partial [archaeon]
SKEFLLTLDLILIALTAMLVQPFLQYVLGAILIGAVAWIAALVVLFVIDTVLQLGIGAFGIPGA